MVVLATVKLGQLLIEGRERGEVANPGRPTNVDVDDYLNANYELAGRPEWIYPLRFPQIPGPSGTPTTLADLAISRDLSWTSQRLARHAEEVLAFVEHSAELSVAGALRRIKPLEKKDDDEEFERRYPVTRWSADLADVRRHLWAAQAAIEALIPLSKMQRRVIDHHLRRIRYKSRRRTASRQAPRTEPSSKLK
ncbi:MAG TPA: hypothetical protein VIM30_10370 [Candidatus Limnocylindrales bacterium]|jgi:hypothetical protein